MIAIHHLDALDLYVPDLPRALCVYLHGGGWRAGSRRDAPGGSFALLAELGLAVASVSYRFSTEAVFPAQLDDVTAALFFLAEHRVDYGVTTSRTVAWGASAGGHLAALAGLSTDMLSAVACWYAPTDLLALSHDVDAAGGTGDRSAGSREGMLIGAALDDRPDLARAASPVSYAHPAAPPFLFVHGTADTAVPLRQSERLSSLLDGHGVRTRIRQVPGGAHMFPGLDVGDLVLQTVDFLLGVGPD